ncbi:hypothetical protein KY331_01455 [Candidatus Woesearchaeota archaeon]|nr:hypothetical protein [Candidatus Woesearchaeota archaeon]
MTERTSGASDTTPQQTTPPASGSEEVTPPNIPSLHDTKFSCASKKNAQCFAVFSTVLMLLGPVVVIVGVLSSSRVINIKKLSNVANTIISIVEIIVGIALFIGISIISTMVALICCKDYIDFNADPAR